MSDLSTIKDLTQIGAAAASITAPFIAKEAAGKDVDIPEGPSLEDMETEAIAGAKAGKQALLKKKKAGQTVFSSPFGVDDIAASTLRTPTLGSR